MEDPFIPCLPIRERHFVIVWAAVIRLAKPKMGNVWAVVIRRGWVMRIRK